MDNKYTVGIITASDKGSKGEREDISGRRIREILPAENYEVVSYKVLPDEQEELEQELETLSHAEEIKGSLYKITQLLDGEEQGAVQLIKEALSTADSLDGIFHAGCDTGGNACGL